MTKKQEEYRAKVESLLRENGIHNSGSTLVFLPVEYLKAIYEYLTGAPRLTPIGAQLTATEASQIVHKTLQFRGDIRLAMRLNSPDNQYDRILNSLRKTGTEVSLSSLNEMPDDLAIKYSALLYAETIVFERLNYHPDSKTDKVLALYRYVEENPAQAARIMDVAKQRYCLDVGLIKDVLEMNVPALETGML